MSNLNRSSKLKEEIPCCMGGEVAFNSKGKCTANLKTLPEELRSGMDIGIKTLTYKKGKNGEIYRVDKETGRIFGEMSKERQDKVNSRLETRQSKEMEH